jgi:phage/plasmid-like protein (TIGR03299 family)
MFSVREMPWHREGTVLDDYPQTWDEARKYAGLEWDPVEGPVFTRTPDGNLVEVPDWRAITRGEGGRVLACTKDSYAVITHTAFGEIFEAVLETDRNALKAETGGELEGGRKVWMLIKLDEPIMLPGDTSPSMPYLALTSRHDSMGGCVLRATAVRIVCANTFGAAEMEGQRTGATFTFIHRTSWRDRIEEARNAVTGARKQFADYADLMSRLTGVKVTAEQTELFVKAFIPSPPESMISDRVAKNIETARQAVRTIIASPTVEGAGVRGTAYGLVQAAGEYLDHSRKARSWETKMNRTLLTQEPLKAKAVKLALQAANA